MKKIILLILLFFSYQSVKSQCTTDCITRDVLAGLIYEVVYNGDNPDNYPAVNYPNPFIDVNSSADINKKISIVSYLDYNDGITVLGHLSSGNYLISQGTVGRGEALVALMEAWNIKPDFSGSVSYSDVDSNHEYYGYINEAEDLNLLNGLFGGTFNEDFGITATELVTIISRIQSTSYHPVSTSVLKNEDNYFTPNNYQPNNIGFLRGLEQGVFSHYAKNSFVIPDRKLNLNFSHYYSTQLVELPQSYFPIEPLGRGWTHTYNSYIVRESTFNTQTGLGTYHYNIKWADGSIDIYDIDASKYLTLGVYDQLGEIGSGNKISIYKKSGVEYIFERLDSDKEIFYLTRIKELNSNEINIEYEQSDVDNDFERIEWVESPTGKKLHFYYHNNTDLIDYIEDPINRQISFTYNDELERLKRFYDAKNQNTRYYYLASDDEAPEEHQYKQYLLRKIRLPKGNKIEAEYDEDDDGKLVSYQVNDNIATEIVTDYSDYRAITSTVTAPMPNSGDTQDYIYEFDANGMVSQFKNNNQNININYPNPTADNPLLPTNVDVNGLDVDYTYDDNGNVTSIQVENNEDEDFWYDIDHNLTHYRDENNNDTYFTYDTRKNLTSIEDALGNTINLNYSFYGELLSVTNQEGITVNYTYADGVVTSITAPEGLESSFNYDGINRLLSQTINGQTSSFIYDPNDNLKSHTNIGGLTTTFNYDENDNLITITNEKGVNTSFTYNNEDQVTSETFGSLVKKYEYNDDGTLDKYIKPSGLEIEYGYLSDGKLNNAGTIADIDHFDANDGKKEGLIKSIASDDIRYNFDYDFLNRLDEVDIEDEPDLNIDYDYDAVGNVIKITYPKGNNNQKIEVLYGYDAKNRMVGIGTGRLVNYTYRDDDLIATVNYGNIVTGTFSYDDAGRKTGVTYRYGGASNEIIFSESVVLDERGNIVSENRYYANQETGSHSYIPPTQNYTYNENNHLQQAGDNSFVFNQDGNMTYRSTPDGIPGVNDVGEAHLTYNIDDQLISITGSNIPNYNRTYKYDAYGNRTKRTYSSGSSTNYVWDIINNNVIFEQYDSNSGLQDRSLIYGALGLEMSVSGTNWNESLIYLGDLRGSVVATVTQPSSSHPSSEYSFNKYDDFGNLVNGAYDLYTDNFKYLGKYGIILEDVHTGHYYIKARHYDALTGRFFTQDPIWSTNLYPYSDNNPISRIDVDGKKDTSIFTNSSLSNYFYDNGYGDAANLLSQENEAWDFALNNPEVSGLIIGIGVTTGASALLNGALYGAITINGVGNVSGQYLISTATKSLYFTYVSANRGNLGERVFVYLGRLEDNKFKSLEGVFDNK